MKYPALFVSDAHSDGGPDASYALQQVSALARRKKVEVVIGCGDLIHKQRNRSAAIAPWAMLLHELREADVAFEFIQGQHDLDDPPWLDGLSPIAYHLDGRTTEHGGFTFRGLDFRTSAGLAEALDAFTTRVDVLVCHQVWADWMGEVCNPQGAFRQVRSARTLVSGDLHQLKHEKVSGADGPLTVCSPGATWQLAVNEPPEHYVVLLREDGVLCPRKLKSRPFINGPTLNTPEDLEAFVATAVITAEKAAEAAAAAGLPDELCVPKFRYVYGHALPDAPRRVERAVGGKAVLRPSAIPPEPQGAFTASLGGGPGDEALTVLTALPLVVDRAKEPAVYDLIETCLHAQDKAAAFVAWREKFMESHA